MKAILFVILNVSVCFPSGSVGVEILIPGGFGGVERKKISRLAIARHDPPCNTTFNFYPALNYMKSYVHMYSYRAVLVIHIGWTSTADSG